MKGLPIIVLLEVFMLLLGFFVYCWWWVVLFCFFLCFCVIGFVDLFFGFDFGVSRGCVWSCAYLTRINRVVYVES